jgi:tetratricopeptide (TPR) repeat protein
MSSVNQTVFISYRRNASLYLASAIFHDLVAYGGYRPQDIYVDMSRIDSGKLEPSVLRQISACTHFVVVLTTVAVERWNERSDWGRLEAEHAIEIGRHIIPLLVRDFVFEDVERLLHGKLGALRQHAPIRIFHEHLEDALPMLRQRLAEPLPQSIAITPLPDEERGLVEKNMSEFAKRAAPAKKHLRAEALYDRGLTHWRLGDVDEAINNYDKAIQLFPEYVSVYSSRGLAYVSKELYERALADFAKAMALEPGYAPAYNNRAGLYRAIGYYDLAIADYTQAIQLYPHFDKPHNNRGELWFSVGHFQQALADFRRAEELKPEYPFGIAGMAIAHHALGNVEEAKQLWRKLIAMNKHFSNLQWVQKRLRWDESLIAEARKFVNNL